MTLEILSLLAVILKLGQLEFHTKLNLDGSQCCVVGPESGKRLFSLQDYCSRFEIQNPLWIRGGTRYGVGLGSVRRPGWDLLWVMIGILCGSRFRLTVGPGSDPQSWSHHGSGSGPSGRWLGPIVDPG